MKKRRILGLLLTIGMILGMSVVAQAKEAPRTIVFGIPGYNDTVNYREIAKGDIVKKGTTIKSAQVGNSISLVDFFIDNQSSAANHAIFGANGNLPIDKDYVVSEEIYGPERSEQSTISGQPTTVMYKYKFYLSTAPTSISLSATSLKLAAGGDTATLTATISPDDAADKTVTWASDNTAVATVDSNGVVKPVKEGTAVITVKCNANPEVKATCTVTVEMSAADKKAAPTAQQEKITISKAPVLKKLKSKKNKVQVTWNKIRKNKAGKKLIKQIKYIEIQAARDPEFQNIVATKNVGKKKSKTVLKLGRKTTYFVRVRYVGNDGVSKWSKVKKIKTK